MIYDLRFMICYWTIGLLGYLFIGLFSPSASAQTMSNDNFILQLDSVNTTNPEPSVKNATLGVKTKQVDKKQNNFSFSISDTLIDLSTLSPINPIKRSNKLTVSGSPTGYSIIAFEDKELSALIPSDVASSSSDFIRDTSCDNDLCSEMRSGPWTNPLTYGFGYRCDNKVGNDCTDGFSDPTFYKQFANSFLSETPQKIASATNTGKNKTVQITYKVNIPGTQQFAFYNNTITYIAVPNF
jgi:hypothetical protein